MKKSLILLAAVFSAIISVDGAGFVRQTIVCGGEAETLRIEAKLPTDFNCRPTECGKVKALCNGKELKFIFDMSDSDIFSEAAADQTKLASMGDAVTILLKSEKDTWIWEFIAAPNGKRAGFLHPGAGCIFYPVDSKCPDFKVENKISKGKWQCIVTIPEKIFKAKGLKLTSKDKWTVMLIRKNFSRFLPDKENSCYPQSPAGNTDPKFYAELVIR